MMWIETILSNAYADKSVYKHWCYKPEKPLFSVLSSFQYDYRKDLVHYQQCLQNYIQKQNKEILIHQENIDKTLKELEQSVDEINS
jgi:hypothetical protein